jgi:pimeloyl-[acyl-carrier protein] synthase
MRMAEFFGSDAFRVNPYPFYKALREEADVHPGPFGGWAAVTVESVQVVLQDPRVSSARSTEGQLAGGAEEIAQFIKTISLQMPFLDPPDHTRLRRLVAKAFTGKAVEALRPHVAAVVTDMLAALIPRGEMEAMADLITPLNIAVIGGMLGVPPEDHTKFGMWAADMLAAIDPDANAEALATGGASARKFTDYFETLIAATMRRPQDNILSGLLQAEEDGEALTMNELTATAMLLLIAGFDAIRNALANGIRALAAHPAERSRLADSGDPQLLKQAVEELFRYDPPVQLVIRRATEDFDLLGTHVRAGDQLMACLASANRDAAVYNCPEQLDFSRGAVRHQSFGRGIHFCLGAPLARLQCQELFAAILRAVPDFSVPEANLDYIRHSMFRGLVSLPVTW